MIRLNRGIKDAPGSSALIGALVGWGIFTPFQRKEEADERMRPMRPSCSSPSILPESSGASNRNSMTAPCAATVMAVTERAEGHGLRQYRLPAGPVAEMKACCS
jgi:hypothetical protein